MGIKEGQAMGENLEEYCVRTGRLLLQEWDQERNGGLRPQQVAQNSEKTVWWKCELGHSWQARVFARTGSGHTGCPVCKGFVLQQGFNDIATKYPELAKEWDTEKNGANTPDRITERSPRRIWWRCSRGHTWRARLSTRIDRKEKCPICKENAPWYGSK